MRLITFGDSWTAGHGVEKDIKYKENANPPLFIQKLREQNSWPRYLAQRINIPFVNLGICGIGNEYIYQSVETNLEFLRKTDIIIITFTYPYRYEKYNKYTPFELFNKFEELLNDYKRFYFNAFYPFLDDVKNLPKHYINPKGTLAYQLELAEILNKETVWEYDSKLVWNDEEKFYEGDYHPNLNGYKIISQYIYNEIRDLI